MEVVSNGQWTESEAGQSSTWRELAAVLQVLLGVAKKLTNHRVRWYTDNQNVARILMVGSKKPHLHALALKVFSLSIHNNIKLEPEWILNERADLLCRIVDYDDWMLNPVVFAEVDRLWGPHSVDRFANWQNCQTTRFNSRCWSPGSEAVDAFTVDWGKENNWVCPPISLIPRIIRHAQVCMARATMLVPVWTMALCPDGAGCFAPFVREARALPRVATLFLPRLSGACLVGSEVPNTDVWVLRCDFSERESPLVQWPGPADRFHIDT